MRFTTLKRSAEFKRLRGGVRIRSELFVIEGRARSARPDGGPADVEVPRFGFTITRKLGNAVVRNRIRRRLREALRTLETPFVRADHDYVVVASRAAQDYPFAELQSALRTAFEQLHQQAESGSARGGKKRRRPPGKGGPPAQRAGEVPLQRKPAGGEHAAPGTPADEPHEAAPDNGKRGRATD